MQTQQGISQTQRLGDFVAAAYEVSSAVAPDRAMANALAARHLERVLARGANVRLVAALRGLARELAPARVRRARSNVRDTGGAPLVEAAA
jgi:hypothetical protein